jgi:hypothetical protein
MSTTIAALAANVQSRLEEPSGVGIFWSRQYELFTSLVEAMNDLILLIGRPTQTVNIQFSLTPNTVWQTVTKGLFLITDIQGAGAPLYKVNLWELDYTQASWGSDWQQDVYDTAFRWAPIGFNMFAIHPAVSAQQTVNITAIQYPTSDTWPYSGNETVPFEDNYFQALEEYAAFYASIKEMGGEFQNGLKLFQAYMKVAQRMTQIQDRRDPLIFSMNFGAGQSTNPTTQR